MTGKKGRATDPPGSSRNEHWLERVQPLPRLNPAPRSCPRAPPTPLTPAGAAALTPAV